jgi:hypothetical protein
VRAHAYGKSRTKPPTNTFRKNNANVSCIPTFISLIHVPSVTVAQVVHGRVATGPPSYFTTTYLRSPKTPLHCNIHASTCPVTTSSYQPWNRIIKSIDRLARRTPLLSRLRNCQKPVPSRDGPGDHPTLQPTPTDRLVVSPAATDDPRSSPTRILFSLCRRHERHILALMSWFRDPRIQRLYSWVPAPLRTE